MTDCRRLRQLVESPEVLVMPGVFDGLSTRLVKQAGFETAFVTGSGLSESVLGQPDVGLMGLAENLGACRAIAACGGGLLMIADADTGYGNAINVYHAQKAFEQAGIAGMMIEDQVWPKRCGHMKGKEVVPAEEMVEKIKAAAAARTDPDFIVMSRTDALATHGIEEVVRRLNLYAEAGADLLFADAVMSEEDIRTVVGNVSKPVTVNMGFGLSRRSTTPLLSAHDLQELGVRVAIFPRLLTTCAIRGMLNGLAAMQESLDTKKVVERPDLQVTFDELQTLVGFPEVMELEQKFLSPERLKAKYGQS